MERTSRPHQRDIGKQQTCRRRTAGRGGVRVGSRSTGRGRFGERDLRVHQRIGNSANCQSTPTSFAIGLGPNTFAEGLGLFDGAIANRVTNGAKSPKRPRVSNSAEVRPVDVVSVTCGDPLFRPVRYRVLTGVVCGAGTDAQRRDRERDKAVGSK